MQPSWGSLSMLAATLFLASLLLSTLTTAEPRRRSGSRLFQADPAEAAEDSAGTKTRDGKLFSVFNVIRFKQTSCTATSGLTGTCLSASECSNRGEGSVSSGNCASGFGVCCVTQLKTCGATVNHNCTYIQNPGYSSTYNTAGTCSYTIRQCASNICRIRLDYVDFKLQGPDLANNAMCSNDNLVITGTNNAGSAIPNPINPTYCGIGTGQHIYYDVGGDNQANLNLAFTIGGTNTNFARSWNIKVTQIPCDSCLLPPAGCDQYFMGVSGNVKSWNFDQTATADFAHLPNQDLQHCIRQEPGYCMVRWMPSTDEDSFRITGDLTTAKAMNGQRCSADSVYIPQGTNMADVGCFTTGLLTSFVDTVDRYCGAKLSCLRGYPTSVPVYSEAFYIRTVFDEMDASPNQNRGFNLNYLQVPC